jgi:hypothetical protein
MATFEDVKSLADATYQRIWRDWYKDFPDMRPAHQDLQLCDLSAGYSHSRNWLLNPICDGNLDDCDILDADAWPIWKIQLVHEMLHEYQAKVISSPSSVGICLHARFRATFCGKGHDEKFFTAIAEKASYFGMTPEDLIAHI